jgi:hypothetical protein
MPPKIYIIYLQTRKDSLRIHRKSTATGFVTFADLKQYCIKPLSYSTMQLKYLLIHRCINEAILKGNRLNVSYSYALLWKYLPPTIADVIKVTSSTVFAVNILVTCDVLDLMHYFVKHAATNEINILDNLIADSNYKHNAVNYRKCFKTKDSRNYYIKFLIWSPRKRGKKMWQITVTYNSYPNTLINSSYSRIKKSNKRANCGIVTLNLGQKLY